MIKSKFLNRFQHLPTATGLALGLSSFGSILDNEFHYGGSIYNGGGPLYPNNVNGIEASEQWWISIFFIFLSTILLTITVIKFFRFRKLFSFELQNPLFVSLMPTFSMALMSIGGFIAGWDIKTTSNGFQIVGAILLLSGVVTQLPLIYLFFKNVLVKFKWHEHPMYGSWFIPTVGLVTSATFAERFNQGVLPAYFFQAIWFFAFISFLIAVGPITYSLLFKTKVTHDKFPSVVIYFAPPNLLLAAFIQSFAIPGVLGQIGNAYPLDFYNVIIIIFVAISITMTFFMWVFSLKVFQTKFDFIFASLGFPLFIGATSIIYTSWYVHLLIALKGMTNLIIIGQTLAVIGWIFTSVACAILTYVSILSFFKIGQILFTNKFDKKEHPVLAKQKIIS